MAIVASILLAFAVDAWWAERLDRRTELEELNRLEQEFAENDEQSGSQQSRRKKLPVAQTN